MALPPAPRPCASCPYRQDVPAGIWDASEYDKLPAYDAPTGDQPTALFLCHQHDHGSNRARICSGWAGCHDTHNLLALRIAAASGAISGATTEAVLDYTSPVALFASGAEAATHGRSALHSPSPGAIEAIRKITRTRSDLTEEPTGRSPAR